MMALRASRRQRATCPPAPRIWSASAGTFERQGRLLPVSWSPCDTFKSLPHRVRKAMTALRDRSNHVFEDADACGEAAGQREGRGPPQV